MNDKINTETLMPQPVSFEYIFLLHTLSGTYELYGNNSQNQLALARTGFFNEIIAYISDHYIAAAQRDTYFEKARLETIIRFMRENGGRYSYRYILPDGEREASFSYFESSHSDILMTVRRLDKTPDEIAAIQHEKEYRDVMQAAIVHSGLDFWEYYPDNDTAIVTQYNSCYHIFANATIAESGTKIADYPEAWIELGYVHPDDIEKIRTVIKAIKDGQAKASYERRIMYEDGRYHWERVRFTSIYDQNGNRLKVICSNENIDNYKNLEIRYTSNLACCQALKYKALLFCHLNITRNLVNDVQSKSSYLAEQLSVITVEDLFSGLLQFTSEGVWKKKLAATLNIGWLTSQLECGITHHKVEHRCYTALNRVEWVETSLDLTHNPSTGDVEAFIFAVSINGQKIVDAVMNKIIVNEYENITAIDVEHDNYISYGAANRSAVMRSERGSNFSREIVVFIEQQVLPVERERVIKEVSPQNAIVQLTKQPRVDIYFQLSPAGHSVRRQRWRYSWLDKEANLLMLTRHDITDIYEAERCRNEELARALHNAKAANAAKNDFLAHMSHDMRTPMNAIIGMSELALTSEISERQRLQYLNSLQDSSKYLLSLINDTLDMSSIDQDKIKLNCSVINFDSVFSGVKSMVCSRAEEKGLNLIFTFSDTINRWVVADKSRIQQVLINLINNAIKFTPPGGTINVATSVLEDDGEAISFCFIISDTGIGMKKDFLDKMFMPFEQERPNQEGTGLGLAIVKKLLDLMGGTIEVQSEAGCGTVFTINITCKAALPEQLAAVSEAVDADPEEEENKLAGKRVLLVEDNELNAMIAQDMLELKKMLVETAENGQIAVNMFAASACGYYNAVLMDIRMPVMDGLEAVRVIRSLDRPDAAVVPVIALSANVFEDDRRKSTAAGMSEHLGKPIEPVKMFAVLNKLIKARPEK